ncbi:hypothetical protein D3C72_1268110 [compost metagenome]
MQLLVFCHLRIGWSRIFLLQNYYHLVCMQFLNIDLYYLYLSSRLLFLADRTHLFFDLSKDTSRRGYLLEKMTQGLFRDLFYRRHNPQVEIHYLDNLLVEFLHIPILREHVTD